MRRFHDADSDYSIRSLGRVTVPGASTARRVASLRRLDQAAEERGDARGTQDPVPVLVPVGHRNPQYSIGLGGMTSST